MFWEESSEVVGQIYPDHSYIMQEKYKVEAIAKIMPDLKNVYVFLLYYTYVPIQIFFYWIICKLASVLNII